VTSASVQWLLLESRDALRRLRRAPAFVLALGLSYGVGVWTALTAAALAGHYGLRSPAGVGEPSSLRRVLVGRSSGVAPYALAPVVSHPELEQLRTFHDVVQIEGYSPDFAMVGSGKARRRTSIALTTTGFLRLLRVKLQAGRFPDADDEQTGGPSVALISDRVWQRNFARSRSAVDSVISINGQAVRVIGILSSHFVGLDRTITDVWLPIRSAPIQTGHRRTSATSYYLSVVARVPRAEQAPSIERMLLTALAERSESGERVTGVRLERIAADRIGREAASGRSAFFALFFACSVLLLSLANCILLVLARLQHRLQELCTRAAVGARIEALLLNVGLEIGIIMVAFTGLALIAVAPSKHLWPLGAPGDSPTLVDGTLLWIAVFLMVSVFLLVFGCSTVGLVARLRRPLLTTHSPLSGVGIRQLLIGGYVALVCALTIACLPVARAYLALRSVQPGFNPSNAVVTTVASAQPADNGDWMLKLRTVLNRLQALPFTSVVAASSGLPYRTSTTRPIGRSSGNQGIALSHVYYVLGDFLGALGVPVELGHARRLAEAPSGDFVVINRALAQKWWSGSPIGRCVFANGDRCNIIVAVAANADAIGFGETPRPTVYAPITWLPSAETIHFVLRTKARPTMEEMRLVDWTVGELFPSATTHTELLSDIAREQTAPFRLVARLAMLLLSIAALLGLSGLRASVRYSVQRRSHQFGVQAALGASPATLMRSALSDLVLPSLAGAVAGAWLGVSAAKLLSAVMPGFQGSLLMQLSLGALAPSVLLALSVSPAWRMSRQQPRALLTG